MKFLDPGQQEKIFRIGEFPATLSLSFDVGLTETDVEIDKDSIHLSAEEKIPLPAADLFDLKEQRTILVFDGGEWEKWQQFDDATNKFYKMVFVTSQKPPTVEISGIKMHVTMNGHPALDTANKLRALGPVHGRVLDCCCGLGYTAIALSRLPGISSVTVFERDENMLKLAKENPWSRELFQSPKINLSPGNTADRISEFENGSFSGILHDPPRFALSPELYEVRFYEECLRVLQKKGRLYHYTGDPNKSRGRGLPEKTIERLLTAGFRKAKKAYQGVWAQK